MRQSVIQVWFALTVVTLLVACGGGGKSDSEKALDVAKQWSQSSVDAVSDAIVELIIGEVPIAGSLASSVIADQIDDRLEWSYSEPVNESGKIYRVTATASAEPEFSVPLLGSRTYEVKLPFDLQVDVSSGEVTRWLPGLTEASVAEK